MDVKDQTRVIGFDDGPFTFEDDTCAFAGVMTRGGGYVEAVFSSRVQVDGTDATDTVLDLLEASGFEQTAQAVAFNGGSVGGFNVLDLERLHDELGLPAVAVTREEPDPAAVRAALEEHVPDPQTRAERLQAQPVHAVDLEAGTCYIRHAGGDTERLAELIRLQTVRGLNPEPLRIAHLVATAMAEGRSRGA